MLLERILGQDPFHGATVLGMAKDEASAPWHFLAGKNKIPFLIVFIEKGRMGVHEMIYGRQRADVL
jgi:hypothetical protein